MDLKIYVDADPGLRFIRRARRDVGERGRTLHSVVKQYQDSVQPMHQTFIQPTKEYADLVLENSGSLENLATLLDGVTAEILKWAALPAGAADDEVLDDLARSSPHEHYARKWQAFETHGKVVAAEGCKAPN